jgi:hypothetical protein
MIICREAALGAVFMEETLRRPARHFSKTEYAGAELNNRIELNSLGKSSFSRGRAVRL